MQGSASTAANEEPSFSPQIPLSTELHDGSDSTGFNFWLGRNVSQTTWKNEDKEEHTHDKKEEQVHLEMSIQLRQSPHGTESLTPVTVFVTEKFRIRLSSYKMEVMASRDPFSRFQPLYRGSNNSKLEIRMVLTKIMSNRPIINLATL